MTAELEPNLPPVGARVTRTRTITDQDIVRFAEVSGDTNPVHLDEAYAAQSRFGRRIAHGFLTGSMISALIGTELPGPGSIYLGQTLKFSAPVYIGDTITVSVEVTKVRVDKGLVFLQTDCINQDGARVLTGEATVKYEPDPSVAP
ncbi:MaoC family dehydratase [Ktedonobacter racemifer]|uniref:MaoC domain protein dehydratase n=1 Tax=Ktedonobacter racemifer DSM 44963 TaxID=485913 RepID=D6TSR2_KTERA|nr:MaoC family dehydratase [Ktedonobacter racemifer]EFH83463.1 MaoC domain protein dehydratase [Ktedonobacter racemifer DSM 44963]